MSILNDFFRKKPIQLKPASPKKIQKQKNVTGISEPCISQETNSVSKPEVQKPAPNKRSIRVFISSTFRDMVEDRNALMTHCWPELRRFCRERQVELLEVDMRWGIAEEQSTRKETLKLCLDEIRACRPFFIGLLGERYGWVPGEDAFTKDLIEEQPWLNETNGKSVTELEILHGVLNDPEMASKAFFYFRDPKYIETVPKKKKANFHSETPADTEKQTKLKELIRISCKTKGIPLLETYKDPQSLAPIVLEQLKAAIDAQFPIEDNLDQLTLAARGHEAFAESRRKTYILRPDYFKTLDHHCVGIGKPILILGDSGSGKSSLIANWVDHWRKDHPKDFIFQHYIGGTIDSAVHWKIMTRLMSEIKEWTEDSEEVPKTNDNIVRDFAVWLAKARIKAAQDGIKFIVIMDALNELEDKDYAHNLGWLLTEPFRDNLRLIVSTLPGDTLEAIEKNGLETIMVKPLKSNEIEEFTTKYLKRFGKKLDSKFVEKLTKTIATSNPLYLRILLDELRITGTFDNLEKRLDEYLSAKDIPSLLQKVFSRYQKDYEQDHKGLVGEVLGMIWAARRGLTEVELLELLRPANLPQLPLVIWSPLRAALEDNFIDRDGILNFSYDFFRIAIEKTFLVNTEKIDTLRTKLVDYFEQIPLTKRVTDELPWLLLKVKSFKRLEHCLLNIDCSIEIIDKDMTELYKYWVSFYNIRNLDQIYLLEFNKWRKNKSESRIAHVANSLSGFLADAGYLTVAESLIRVALDIDVKQFGEIHPNVTIRMSNLATLLHRMGKFKDAEILLRKAGMIDVVLLGADHPNVAIRLSNIGSLLLDVEDYKEAEQLFYKALKIDILNFGNESLKVAEDINNLCQVLRATNKYSTAEPLMRQAVKLFEKNLGENHPLVASSYNNLGVMLKETGSVKEAKIMIEKALKIHEICYGPVHSTVALDLLNLAHFYKDNRQVDQAEVMLRRAISIFEKTDGLYHAHVAAGLNSLGRLLKESKRIEEAEGLYRRAIKIDEEFLTNEHSTLAMHLNNLSLLLSETNRQEEAISIQKKVVRIIEENLGENHPNVAIALDNLAMQLCEEGRFNEAEPICRRALEIFIKHMKETGQPHPEFKHTTQNYTGMLQDMKISKEEIKTRVQQIAMDSVGTKNFTFEDMEKITPEQIRTLSIKMYEIGKFNEAKGGFLVLLSKSFEILSIYVQLTRVCIMLDQFAEAYEYLEKAWSKISDAKNYIAARILWFKLCQSFLKRKNNIEISIIIGQLKSILQKDDAFMKWTMQPVLDHIKPQIKEHQHAFLSALVDAMSDKQNLEKLNDFEEWRDAKPEEIE